MLVYLVEAGEPETNVFSSFSSLPRLGLPILGAVARNEGHRVKILNPRYTQVRPETLPRADLVGISSTSASLHRAIGYARRFAAAGSKVVLGGSHATFEARRLLLHNPSLFAVVRGEGERVFASLLRVLDRGGDPSTVRGLTYRCEETGEVVDNEPESYIEDLDSVPSPAWELVQGARFPVYPVQTSRGCPHLCDFCTVTAVFGHRYRFKSVERVMEEMEEIRRYKEMGIFSDFYRFARKDLVFFYDDNLAPRGKANRERTTELLRRLLERGLLDPRRRRWVAQADVHLAEDDKLLGLMARSGCRTLFQGFESPNDATLKEWRKRQTRDDLVRMVEAAHRHGIRINAMFMVGGEHDDPGTMGRIVDLALETGIDVLIIYFLTPFPGTGIYSRYAHRILDPSFSTFDLDHVTISGLRPGPSWLQAELYRQYRRFYSLPRVLGDFARHPDFHLLKTRLAGRLILHAHQRATRRFVEMLKARGM